LVLVFSFFLIYAFFYLFKRAFANFVVSIKFFSLYYNSSPNFSFSNPISKDYIFPWFKIYFLRRNTYKSVNALKHRSRYYSLYYFRGTDTAVFVHSFHTIYVLHPSAVRLIDSFYVEPSKIIVISI
jgi:hypothetical protein